MFYGGNENVFKVETTPLVSKRIHESGNDKSGEKISATEGGARWFCYSLLGKQVPFLQRLYYCLPLWIAFLLPLVRTWRENTHCVSRQKKKNEKKIGKQTSDLDLWHSSLANRGKNQDEQFSCSQLIYKQKCPKFYSPHVQWDGFLFYSTFRLFIIFVHVLHIFKIRSYKQLTCDNRDALCHC